jgi:hypothetical protein
MKKLFSSSFRFPNGHPSRQELFVGASKPNVCYAIGSQESI